MPRKLTQVEIYMEALRQLEVAVDELDQAHSTLRQVDMERYSASRVRNRGRLTIKEIYEHAESLLKDLNAADCEECGALIVMHPVEGCKEWRD